LSQEFDYIYQNLVKRGFIDEPEHWRWSSARRYAGRVGIIEVYRLVICGAERRPSVTSLSGVTR